MRTARWAARTFLVIAISGVSLLAASAAGAATGELVQKPGDARCIAAGGPFDLGCGEAAILNGAADVALSPDGENAYVAASGEHAVDTGGIAIFDRDPATGQLTQKPGAPGCITDDGSAGECAVGVAVTHPGRVTVSPDGENVYVVAGGSTESAIAIFDRDVSTGELTQKAGTAGCVSDDGSGGACVNGRSLRSPGRLAITSDGTSAYVTSFGITTGGLAIFDRDPRTGALAQRAAAAGCVSDDGSAGECQIGRELKQAISVTTSPDAKSVYVISFFNGIAIFDRNPTSGVLTQKAGQAGCLTDSGSGGTCADGRAMMLPQAMTVSRDGASAYLAAGGTLAVLIAIR